MGTSISHRSPSTPNWHAAISTYGTEAFTVDRVVKEIWRAATNQPIGDLKSDLAAPIISQCLGAALNAESPEQAYHNTSRMIALSGFSTLATDIAKRAVVSSFLKTENRNANFVKSLFSEAVNYLISRDLPSYVGTGDRIKNVSATMDFKKQVKNEVETIVGRHPIPNGLERDAEAWKTYVERTISSLAGK
jgi:hypothetical protein